MSDDFVAGQCYDLTGDPTTVGMHYLEFADGGAPFTEGFYYGGAEKTYKVHANIPWKVSTNRREAVITIVDNETFKVKLPKSIACAPRTLTVTLSPSAEISEVSPKTFSTVWGSPVWSGGDGWNLDSETGSATLTINNAVGRLFSIDKYKYGYFEWTFSNVNISQGDLSIVGGKINTNNEPLSFLRQTKMHTQPMVWSTTRQKFILGMITVGFRSHNSDLLQQGIRLHQ